MFANSSFLSYGCVMVSLHSADVRGSNRSTERRAHLTASQLRLTQTQTWEPSISCDLLAKCSQAQWWETHRFPVPWGKTSLHKRHHLRQASHTVSSTCAMVRKCCSSGKGLDQLLVEG